MVLAEPELHSQEIQFGSRVHSYKSLFVLEKEGHRAAFCQLFTFNFTFHHGAQRDGIGKQDKNGAMLPLPHTSGHRETL